MRSSNACRALRAGGPHDGGHRAFTETAYVRGGALTLLRQCERAAATGLCTVYTPVCVLRRGAAGPRGEAGPAAGGAGGAAAAAAGLGAGGRDDRRVAQPGRNSVVPGLRHVGGAAQGDSQLGWRARRHRLPLRRGAAAPRGEAGPAAGVAGGGAAAAAGLGAGGRDGRRAPRPGRAVGEGLRTVR